MQVLSKKDIEKISQVLRAGELICSPTDTLFGILGNALDKEVVKKLYSVKKRDVNKPLIVLFSSIEQLVNFGVLVPLKYLNGLKKLYPAPVTVILPLSKESPFRKVFQRDNLAVRIPKDVFLQKLIKKTFPLFAPSANPQGELPAKNCKECKNYFDGVINFCIEGEVSGAPSTIVDLTGEKPILIREGIVKFEKVLEVLSDKTT
ncbi:L-threonylcarbamoyladenylate synthase [Desulfurobacterium thermolithotrophum]|uniref:L-threonylcarbamoyladenylate synthase n=1 Tax=Desulfurobacterium thermolithotrophum TaxID=64160 RepID=UPI0013CFDAB2|nr:L-threonylcarbamoyladenylate synthase [Desulfurobacterium thermolithotrophum]